jgi:hypothetical protein
MQNSAVLNFFLMQNIAVLCGEKCKKCGVCAVEYSKCGRKRQKLNNAIQCGFLKTKLLTPASTFCILEIFTLICL